jgi:hypothetical protein
MEVEMAQEEASRPAPTAESEEIAKKELAAGMESRKKRAREESVDEELMNEASSKMRKGPPRRPCLIPQGSMGIFMDAFSLC